MNGSRSVEADARERLERAWSSKRGIPGFASAVNHKQIGLRFIWTGVAFLFVGGVEGLLLRIQLARPDNTFLGPEAYNQVFTMHGTTMMFLFAVPLLEGLAMYLAPLQLGTRDLPFPRLNAFGYWLYLAGGLLLNWSLVTGSVPDGGWFAYVPLTGPEFSPGRALDFWLLGVTFVEIAGIIGAIELIVVVLRFRAPGMSFRRIPLFVWSVLVMAGMMLVAFPFVIAASLLLELERKFGAPFYDAQWGGNPLLWQHLFWIFGHPEVYIMLLPATGMVSAVVSVGARRSIVAYPLVVASLIAIAVVSFGLWVHHMFAVGLPVMVLSLFAIASYFIAIPSGIQVFAWIATLWDGRPRWTASMWFVAGFVLIFVLGGITGVMVATAPWDHQAHDTFFVVAHFHYVLIGGVVFPILAGLHHWFGKMTGRLPSELVGKVSCGVLFIGFNVTFFPQHWLGLQGMVRRVYTYDEAFGWGASNLVSTIGSFVLATGFVVYFGNLLWAWRAGEPAGDDPWAGDTLEWLTESPPPPHNFDAIPTVAALDPAWSRRRAELPDQVHDAIEVVSRPWRNRREVIQTSVVDALPERIVTLPGPSYWPLVSAGGMTMAIIGVLVDWWILAGSGLVWLVASLVAWADANRRTSVELAGGIDQHDPRNRQRRAADETFADLAPAGRSAVWWAALLGVVAIGTITAAMVYAYVYLRLGADEWPLDGQPAAAIGGPLVAIGLLAVAWLLAPTIRRGALPSFASALVVAAAVAVQIVALVRSGTAIDADAYGALIVTLEGWSAALLISAAGLRIVALGLGRSGIEHTSARDADEVWFTGTTILWFGIWLVIHLGARFL